MEIRATLIPRAGDGDTPHEAIATESNRRRNGRRTLTFAADLSTLSGNETRVTIRDISSGGLLIEADNGALATDDLITLDLPGAGLVAARVIWRSGEVLWM
ncbi:PilZ domain-containing protein [Parafrankia sp. BMG5.11]|uniref:PilZ domain-containing protein n=1 Tax=Parafrankia sp. BMG5.11 TaxID=222540 RepID=UPI00103EE852|nr:PilZ domain-containing protein [Parafrankia sp. BMG5.11]TCJ39510.1 PilZ domain-containing protein [Parafrankia sp. BMG5.11]